MTREQARDLIIEEAMQAESRPCNYVAWNLDLIETTLRRGDFPQLEDLEACAPGEHPVDADIICQESYDPHEDDGFTDQRNDPRYNPDAFLTEGEWLAHCEARFTPEQMVGFTYEDKHLSDDDFDSIPF